MKQNKQEKERKEKRPFIIAIVILSILLALSVAGYGVVLLVKEKQQTDITLGDDLNIKTVMNGSATSYIIYPSIALPGVNYKQKIAIKTTDATCLRAKVVCVHDEKVEEVEVTTTEDWVKGNDGYWYYAGTMKEDIDFATSITLPFALSNKRQSNILSVVVESIVDSTIVLNIWETAPNDWKNILV